MFMENNEAKKTDADYAEELSQKYKVLDRFGLKNVILEACAHVRAEQREKLIAAARRGAEMAREVIPHDAQYYKEGLVYLEANKYPTVDKVVEQFEKEIGNE